MEVLDMYKIAENEKIDIFNYKWNNVKARIFEIENSYSIALDNSKIENSIEEKEILAEELGHYYCNALYYLDSDKILKDKCEYRALKWAYSVLVPLQKLKEKIMQGFNLYDLADYFNVDCEYMNDCIDFYTEKYGILV
ncbi:MAG TPA: ImmA/IrrE family metallo-endopeptidase [Clostridiaceae bacterium]|jgi:hypothetical protein|nr:MAG TPA: IrrE protein [Caudoviricetes sp.]DAN00827.1 MAG TPA: IrrE protein [Caudoviricetes sp.]HJJ14147.1 ImmA/IrrE family metallo-endopeptidase [Clostridiaceae bacterium]